MEEIFDETLDDSFPKFKKIIHTNIRSSTKPKQNKCKEKSDLGTS